MIKIEELEKAGIDYYSGLSRFMDDENLYETVLMAFLGENILERAKKAFDKGDVQALFQVVHEAKGSCGNAGLQALYLEASSLVSLLRWRNYTEDELKTSYYRFEKEYSKVHKAIAEALS